MPNPLTGDFDAVVQISGGTVNRLLASMHQNAFSKPELPSFPHSVRLRIGDDVEIDGVRGRVHAQIGVPLAELIHGATDRVIVEVGIRAWYRPDPGTAPFPTFIHGTVRAEYRLQDIDANCPGWGEKGSEYLWVRVVKDSISFSGTAYEDQAPAEDITVIQSTASGSTAAGSAANVAKVTKQIAALLARRFEATPHPGKGYKRGSIRTLNSPFAGSAVAIPVAITGVPSGQIASIENVIVDGSDFAVAVSAAYIRSLVQPALDAFTNYEKSVPVHVPTDWPAPDIDTAYHVHLDPPTLEWQPQGSLAVMKLKVEGSAKTNSIAADATFKVEQDVLLTFESGGLKVKPGTLYVKVDATGLYHGTVSSEVHKAVSDEVTKIVEAECTKAQTTLDTLPSRTDTLETLMQSIDADAAIWFDEGFFLPDGIIVRGTISLTRRRAPSVQTQRTDEQDGHTALESWIPGGRIDKLEWSWTWFSTRPPGKATYDDRFLLRRPRAMWSRWGAVDIATSLPGVDGSGKVCLTVKGVHVDDVTGRLVPVQSSKRCTRFGFNIATPLRDTGRLFLRDVPELSQDVPFPQLSFVSVRPVRSDRAAANMLMVYLDEPWGEQTASVLAAGLEACGRFDAGLMLLVLFKEGLLGRDGSRTIAAVEQFAERLGISAIVNEDVRGSWSRLLRLRTEHEGAHWALLSPRGAVTWMHRGERVTPEVLTNALDTHLQSGPRPIPIDFDPGLEIGAQVSTAALHPEWSDVRDERCPPLPLGRLGKEGSVISFVQKDAAASELALRRLFDRFGQREPNGPPVVVVVEGATARDTEVLKNELGVDFMTVPDPSGRITDRFRVNVWPTTITLDRRGIVTHITTGFDSGRVEGKVDEKQSR